MRPLGRVRYRDTVRIPGRETRRRAGSRSGREVAIPVRPLDTARGVYPMTSRVLSKNLPDHDNGPPRETNPTERVTKAPSNPSPSPSPFPQSPNGVPIKSKRKKDRLSPDLSPRQISPYLILPFMTSKTVRGSRVPWRVAVLFLFSIDKSTPCPQGWSQYLAVVPTIQGF